MNENLKPCPFCGSEATLIVDNGLYQVECDYCRASAPDDSKKEIAIRDWNRRCLPEDHYLIKIPREVIKEWNEPIEE